MSCTDRDYEYLRGVVRSESANVVDPARNALFETRLSPLARLSGASSVSGLVDLLRTTQPAHLHRAVAEAMTINETSFFRDVKPFDALRAGVLSHLIEARRDEKKLRIWSAGCSTGQEAYSVAMMIGEHFPELRAWDVKILGTDVSRDVLHYAEQGRYRRMEINRGLPARMLVKYFTRDHETWEVKNELRSMCEFRHLNLNTPLPALPRFDLVMLRNVLLYFSQQDRRDVLRAVHGSMAPDGWLLLGNAEQAEDSSDRFAVEFLRESYLYRPIPA